VACHILNHPSVYVELGLWKSIYTACTAELVDHARTANVWSVYFEQVKIEASSKELGFHESLYACGLVQHLWSSGSGSMFLNCVTHPTIIHRLRTLSSHRWSNEILRCCRESDGGTVNASTSIFNWNFAADSICGWMPLQKGLTHNSEKENTARNNQRGECSKAILGINGLHSLVFYEGYKCSNFPRAGLQKKLFCNFKCLSP
jgi:hypothetical protein